MAEDEVGTSPHVFVVDSQANYITMPDEKKSWQARTGQKFFLLLGVLAAMALIIQGYLIYNLYQKIEAMSLAHCQNLSNPKVSALQGGSMSQVGSKGYNVPVMQTQIQDRPFAHLVGSSTPFSNNETIAEKNIVQWMTGGEAFIQNMTYDNGQLTVEKEGYYYLYSKVQHAAVECSLIQHRVMKDTKAYDESIELLKSKNLLCLKHSSSKHANVEDLLSSFLAGVFHLQKGDKIYVTLDNKQSIRPGTTENFMGAFMIFP
ncbi:tumor necrosis factor ligand superfamily member 14-like [Parambassis ranga]|uniref:Tumor necrosis factor ligand superfamily member 14-like n=1 Tax=Parambassis ranga TaxID=210632 RepID=A0A6P7HNN9_9TELE|nr:tumor necrosis factor ligand superfamily member 14-like [Parambassis ranga]